MTPSREPHETAVQSTPEHLSVREYELRWRDDEGHEGSIYFRIEDAEAHDLRTRVPKPGLRQPERLDAQEHRVGVPGGSYDSNRPSTPDEWFDGGVREVGCLRAGVGAVETLMLVLAEHSAGCGCSCKCGWVGDHSIAFGSGTDMLRQHRLHVAEALAADVLDAVRRKAGDDRAEQIAKNIEVLEPKPWYARVARIARETR